MILAVLQLHCCWCHYSGSENGDGVRFRGAKLALSSCPFGDTILTIFSYDWILFFFNLSSSANLHLFVSTTSVDVCQHLPSDLVKCKSSLVLWSWHEYSCRIHYVSKMYNFIIDYHIYVVMIFTWFIRNGICPKV